MRQKVIVLAAILGFVLAILAAVLVHTGRWPALEKYFRG
jgi:hypothetical protein